MGNISPIKKRIIQYLEYKGYSHYKYYQDTDVSRGVLTKDSGVSEDTWTKTIAHYSDLNPLWLLLGVGEMIKSNVSINNVVSEDLIHYAPVKLIEKKDNSKIEYLEKTVSSLNNQLSECIKDKEYLRKQFDESNKTVEFLRKLAEQNIHLKG